jgi:ABC-type transport system involved in multi-copper enzyme maturation permease subunit
MSAERVEHRDPRFAARVVVAEACKLASTRSGAAMLATPIASPAVMVAAQRSNDLAASDRDAIEVLRGIGDVLPVIWLVLGALAVAGEFRDGSIVSTLIAVPHRAGLFAAKLAALAAVAVLSTAAAVAVALGSSAVAGPGTWLDSVSARDLVSSIAAVVGVAPAFAMIGGGIGAVVRHPTAAAVGLLVWTLVAENALPAALGFQDAARWVSSRSAAAVVDVARPQPDTISALAGLGVLAAIAVVAVVIGAAVFDRRDVTG